jgi:hypothetical protein
LAPQVDQEEEEGKGEQKKWRQAGVVPRTHRRNKQGRERRRGGRIGTGSGEEGERPTVSNLSVIGKGEQMAGWE